MASVSAYLEPIREDNNALILEGREKLFRHSFLLHPVAPLLGLVTLLPVYSRHAPYPAPCSIVALEILVLSYHQLFRSSC